MAYVHIAHDCVVGSHTIFANTTNLAGHVEIGDWAILGGCSQVHQYCKIGPHAMTGTGTVVLHDIPPFVMASGNTAAAHGLNAEGLRRRGFDADTIALLRRAYKTLYRSELTLAQAREQLAAQLDALLAARLAPGVAVRPAAPPAASGPSADAVAPTPDAVAPDGPRGAAALGAVDALSLLTAFLGRVERGIVR
jgi:hypothetical protein